MIYVIYNTTQKYLGLYVLKSSKRLNYQNLCVQQNLIPAGLQRCTLTTVRGLAVEMDTEVSRAQDMNLS